MYSKQILAALALVLFTTSICARSVREVLGDELRRPHPGERRLVLSGKGIDDLDGLREAAAAYPRLKILDLSNNKITQIPGGAFLGFSNLEQLSLADNAISRLQNGAHRVPPDQIHNLSGQLELLSSFAGLDSLKGLYFHNNRLISLPDSFGMLANLRELTLHNNRLAVLPEAFGKLIRLQGVHLEHNGLTSLPKSFGNLVALKTLWLGNNRLMYLPEFIGNFSALEKLELMSNRIVRLPESLPRLLSLRKLWLGNNKLGATYNAPPVGVTPLEWLLGSLHLGRVELQGNDLQAKVIDKVRRALPDTEVLA